MISVSLNEMERMVATCVASMRATLNRMAGTIDRKRSGRSGYDTDLEGIGGEMAVAKHFGWYPDLTLAPRRGTPDFVAKGKTIDVKTTPLPNGQLIARPDCGERFDMYILVTGEMPEYQIVGFTEGDVLFSKATLTDLGYGPTHAVKQSQLKPLNPK